MSANIDGLTIDREVMRDAWRQLGTAARQLQAIEAGSRTAEYDARENQRQLRQALANIRAAMARLEHAFDVA